MSDALLMRLRGQRYDGHDDAEAMRLAADEIERLREHAVRIEEWAANGEALVAKHGPISTAFLAGQWWERRPWRTTVQPSSTP